MLGGLTIIAGIACVFVSVCALSGDAEAPLDARRFGAVFLGGGCLLAALGVRMLL